MINRVQTFWNRQSALRRFAITTALGLALFWLLIFQGYCWGWWGRSSFVLQYLFQCSCPAVSENSRYRPFTLLASACEGLELRSISPSTQSLLLVADQPQSRTVHVSLASGTRQELSFSDIPLNKHIDVGLLTDALMLVRTFESFQKSTFSLVDLRNGRRVELPSVEAPTPGVAISSPPITADTWLVVAAAKQVVAAHTTGEYVVVALPADPLQSPENSVVIYNHNVRGHTAVIDELQQRGIAFDLLPPEYLPTGYPSADELRYTRNRRLRADEHGIIDMTSRQRIVDAGVSEYAAERSSPQGWVRDEQAVVYAYRQRYKYLIDGGSGGLLTIRYFAVPQPILLLALPQEYFSKPAP